MKDYRKFLSGLWANHIAQKSEDAPTVISLFAGCGGSSLGYSIAGFRELLAVEWNNNAVGIFKLNFPNIPVFHGDINDCSVDYILRQTGLVEGQLDILDGSPPCQGFSMAGKRQLDDPRNSLFREYVRILRGLKPKVFVMENVAGMVHGKMKLLFAEIMADLKNSGYLVSARVMDMSYFNVPQRRRRMIFIGVRNDLNIKPSHPKGKYKPISAQRALQNLNLDNDPSLAESYIRPNQSIYKYVVQCRQGESAGKYHPRGSYFNTIRLNLCVPAPTITKTLNLVHHSETRYLTSFETARLGSYPDEFKFIGGHTIAVGCIGNSVPPVFMYELAKHIKDVILL